MKKWAVGLLAAALCAAGAWAGTVTYTVTSTNSVEVSGDVPQGAGAVYASTGSQKYRLTADDGMTLRLSGYEGFAITNLVLEMKSNQKSGAGSLRVECEDDVIAEIGTAGFDSKDWHGGFSTDWVEVSPEVRVTPITGDVVIAINATENSLYCRSFTIGYAAADTGSVALPFPAEGAPYTGPWVGVEGFATKGVTDLDDSVRFNEAGDWVRICFDGVPGQLAYVLGDIMFHEDAPSTFLVQESADGERWTTLATWESVPAHSIVPNPMAAYHDLSGASRYVRFFFETKGEESASAWISQVSITEGGPVWPVTVAGGIANGTVVVDRDVAKAGETVTVTATADPDYKLAVLSVNGEPLEHGVTTFEMPDGAAEVSATFAPDWVTLPFPGEGVYQGPWTGDEIGFATEGVDDNGEYAKFGDAGDWLQIRFDGVPGLLAYVLEEDMFDEEKPSTFLVQESADGTNWRTLHAWKSLKPDSGSLPRSHAAYTNLSGASRYVRFFFETKGEDNVDVRITDVIITEGGPAWPVTVAEGIANGTVAVDKTSAKAEETVTVTATPDPNCRLETITVNGTPLESGETTFPMPAEAVEVSATFAEIKDSATLPFFAEGEPYEGPWKGATVDGLTSKGLGADYTSGGALGAKFDSAGDWMQIKFDGTPGRLEYAIKGSSISAASNSTFLVQESADGETWNTLATYNSEDGTLTTAQTGATHELSASSRFVRFYYETKGAGNVGIYSVYITSSGGGGDLHAIAISPYIENGTLSTDPSGTAAAGTWVEVTGIPSDPDNWHLAEVTVLHESSTLSYIYHTSGEPIAFEMPDEDVTLSARFEQNEPPGPGGDGPVIEGDDVGTVGEEVTFTVVPRQEGALVYIQAFEPPQGSSLSMDTLGLDFPLVSFVPDVPGDYRFVFATDDGVTEWTVTVLPSEEELRITKIEVHGTTVRLEYIGDAASVQGTDDLEADTWTPLPSATLDPVNQTATLPAVRKQYLRLSSKPAPVGVQLWKNGPYWAETNIGADNPEDYGIYFWWGDTIGYRRENDAWVASDGSVTNFEFSKKEKTTPTYGLDDATLLSEGWITAEGVLAPEHDAAQAYWGGDWCMPTDDDFTALIDNCDWTWTELNGVNGCLVSGRGDYANYSIFLPAAGYGFTTIVDLAGTDGSLWSSVVPYQSTSRAWGLDFASKGPSLNSDNCYRDMGQTVRPIRREAPVHTGVRLWEGGPEWAETNVGADNPEDYGLFFWWGDTLGYKRENDAWAASDGSVSDYGFFSTNTPTYGLNTDALQSGGWITEEGVLAPAHDAAQSHWGGTWRMPTDAELSALLENCDWTSTTQNGVNGYLVRGRGDYADNSIFIPIPGFGSGNEFYDEGSGGSIWSSVPCSDSRGHAWGYRLKSGELDVTVENYYRCNGFSVRPVRAPAE